MDRGFITSRYIYYDSKELCKEKFLIGNSIALSDGIFYTDKNLLNPIVSEVLLNK